MQSFRKNINITSTSKSNIAKFRYSPFGKCFEKHTKIIENQGEKQIKGIEEHGT